MRFLTSLMFCAFPIWIKHFAIQKKYFQYIDIKANKFQRNTFPLIYNTATTANLYVATKVWTDLPTHISSHLTMLLYYLHYILQIVYIFRMNLECVSLSLYFILVSRLKTFNAMHKILQWMMSFRLFTQSIFNFPSIDWRNRKNIFLISISTFMEEYISSLIDLFPEVIPEIRRTYETIQENEW